MRVPFWAMEFWMTCSMGSSEAVEEGRVSVVALGSLDWVR